MKHTFINKCIAIKTNPSRSHDEHYIVHQDDYPYADDPRSVILEDAYRHTAEIAHNYIIDCFDRKIMTAKQEITDEDYPELNEIISVFWKDESKFCIHIETPAIGFRQEIMYNIERYEEQDIVYLPIASYFRGNNIGGTREYILKNGWFTDFHNAEQWLTEFKSQNPNFRASFLQIRYFHKNTLQNDAWYHMNQQILQATNGCSKKWTYEFATKFDETYCNHVSKSTQI